MLLHGFADPQTTVDVDCACVAEMVYYLLISLVVLQLPGDTRCKSQLSGTIPDQRTSLHSDHTRS